MNLLDKITALKDRFLKMRGDKQDLDTIDSWMEEARRLMLIKSLKDHDGVKFVLEMFDGEVAKINDLLLKSSSKELPDRERDRLLDKRDLASRYVGLFKDIEKDIAALDGLVDKEMI